MRLCLTPTCSEEAVYRGRCRACNGGHQRGQRSAAAKRVYNSKRWRIVRRRQLFDHPLCCTEGCEAVATDVDHVVDIEDGGAPFDPANLQSKCHSCHSRKTRAAQLA